MHDVHVQGNHLQGCQQGFPLLQHFPELSEVVMAPSQQLLFLLWIQADGPLQVQQYSLACVCPATCNYPHTKADGPLTEATTQLYKLIGLPVLGALGHLHSVLL